MFPWVWADIFLSFWVTPAQHSAAEIEGDNQNAGTAESVTAQNTTDTVFLSERQEEILKHWVRCGTSAQRLVFRCRILLLHAEGKGIKTIARRLQCDRNPVRQWICRWDGMQEELQRLEKMEVSLNFYCLRMLEVLADAPRCGAPPKFGSLGFCVAVCMV